MKLRLSSLILLCALSTPTLARHTTAHHTPVESAPLFVTAPAKFYVGIFGGGGTSNNFNVSQYGTAYYAEGAGGPLAVNAFGVLHNQSASFFGMQLGYQTQEMLISPSSPVTLAPAIELEGFGMSNSSFNGTI